MSFLSTLALVALVTGQSLTVLNHCSESVLLYTETSYGTIDNYVNANAGATVNMGISSDWDGNINVGTGCDSTASTCTTGGPTWNGVTPFSRAEFNFYTIPGKVTYDISLVYGYNVGMEISSADTGCDAFACTISSGCPVPGPDGSCYSPCCVNQAGPGPNSAFYYNACYNAYAFPDNDGANGYQPADFVDYTCSNTDITLTLCPGTTSDYRD